MLTLVGFLIVVGLLSLPNLDHVGRKPKGDEDKEDDR